MPEAQAGLHVVLSYGDVFRQSGYRTKVLGELLEYEKRGSLEPFLIVFDRDAARFNELDLAGIRFLAHPRFPLPAAAIHYYRDLSSLRRQGRVRIVHAHNLYSAAVALCWRRRFGYKLLVEYHGRIPEEYVILGKGGRFSHWLLKRLEGWVVRNADHIIPISNKLKDYLLSEYRLDPRKLSVIPDCADPGLFQWNLAMRDSARRKLNLEGKLVCVHLGTFFAFYDPGLTIQTFQRIRSRVTSAHLLVVTEDVAAASAYIDGKLPPDVVTILSARHDEVPNLLAASDLGFLLLPTTPNIAVASPSKFSEYLNSGLPVTITPNVGDFSAMVVDQGVGTILGEDGSFDLKFIEGIMTCRNELAVRCTAAGRQLTWQAFSGTWSRIIEQMSQ